MDVIDKEYCIKNIHLLVSEKGLRETLLEKESIQQMGKAAVCGEKRLRGNSSLKKLL